jgi:hypothetical protein
MSFFVKKNIIHFIRKISFFHINSIRSVIGYTNITPAKDGIWGFGMQTALRREAAVSELSDQNTRGGDCVI